jgi:hypothetical protein
MAVQVNAGDIIRVAVKLSHPTASLIENVWHLYADGTGTADADDVMDVIKTFVSGVYNSFDTYLHEDTQWIEAAASIMLWVVDKWINIGNLGSAGTPVTFVPGGTTDPLPPSNAALTRFITDAPKREGRKYFGGFTEYDVDADARWSSALVTALTAAASYAMGFYGAVASSDISLEMAVPEMDFGSFNLPRAAIIRAAPAVQRRRKFGVGA